MKQAATIELFSYWDSLRAGLDQALLDPAPDHMRAVLANTFLVEVDARRAYPLRVIGATLPRLTANARLGASFLECWTTTSQSLVEGMLSVVHDERLAVVLGAVARMGGTDRTPVEALLLPLAGKRGAKPRILGGIAPCGDLGRRPSPAPLDVVSARAIRTPPQPRGADAPTPDAPMPEPVRPARRRADREASGKPYAGLRVIEGGRSGSAEV